MSDATTERKGGTLGTFAGVFTPSILTILGIILFLRLGYAVGNAGLRNGLIIIGIASGVSALTSISLAAIATNIDVKGGGDYYMISRTLGTEFGGAIGLVLFLAQSVSIAFYAIGFGEAVSAIAGFSGDRVVQVIAVAAVGVLFVFAWLGADVATKFQFVVMALLVASLASFYAGAIPGFDATLAERGWDPPGGALGFWAVFAIFFPAVTGFTQGVSMSGDLKDPRRSLPLGTFLAVGLSTVVYVSVAVLLAGNASTRSLIDDTGAMKSTASIGVLIDAGVIAATLSSAMASFLGAPRILQSLAADRIFPALRFFARGHGASHNPRRAVLLSLAIAVVTIGLGSLNVIAPVVSMFFLISYGLLNYATYYEARAASPSFRPRFRYFNKRLSLAGALACLGAMLAISPVAGGGAVLVLYGIHRYLSTREHPDRWVDASRSHYFQRAKESISAMTAEAEHARNWRPQILAFSADPERRERLLRFGSWMEGESGLTAAVEIVVGEGAVKRKERDERQRTLQQQIDELNLDVHGRAILALDAMDALPVIVQSFGLGPLRANTVLFGWPENPSESRLRGYEHAMREVMRYGVHVVSLSSDAMRWGAMEAIPPKNRRIDVWWEGDDASRLALLGAYLCTRTPEWSRSRIRIIGAASDEHDVAGAAAGLMAMLDEVRIAADVEVVATSDVNTIAKTSSGAALVFLPMRLHRREFVGPFGCNLDALIAAIPMSAAMLAGAPIDLTASPDTGLHEELAAAEEQVEVAERRLHTLEKQLLDAEAELERLRADAANDLSESSPNGLVEAEMRLESLTRRTLTARARVEAAKADMAQVLEGSEFA